MIPGLFDYHRPATVQDAARLAARLGDEARVLAGGHSLIPMMRLRMATPAHLIDLQDIPSLRGIAVSAADIRIGAMTTQHELIAHEALAKAPPPTRPSSPSAFSTSAPAATTFRWRVWAWTGSTPTRPPAASPIAARSG